MKKSFCQMIAFVSILAVGITLIAPIQETDAGRYATREWQRFIDIVHNNGSVTTHTTDSDIRYSIDHSTRTTYLWDGSHWHDSPDYPLTYGGTYTCYLNSQCSICD